jgi:hypothetical protein
MKENQEKLSQRTEIYRALMNEEVKYLKAMQHIIAVRLYESHIYCID